MPFCLHFRPRPGYGAAEQRREAATTLYWSTPVSSSSVPIRCPRGLTVLLLSNISPPEGVPKDWWTLDRGSDEFWMAFRTCEAFGRKLGQCRL